MRTIWGFDLGVTSVGSAVVRWDEWASEPGAGEIVHLGVRIFPESREEKGDRDPKNAARRQSRLARRQVRRRRWRRVELRRLLAGAGLLPADDARPPAGQDPVALRCCGLRLALTPYDLGWALFHLLKRRGFQGSRKRLEADKKAIKDEQEAKGKAQQLEVAMGRRPLGEHLATIATTIEEPKRRRDVGQTRAMVRDELDVLWDTQKQFHPALLTDALRARIDAVALFQRPTFFRRRSIGRCELEPTQERALKADWLTQRFETLQLVNALRLQGGNQRGLDEAERTKALTYLESVRSPSWAGLRTGIGLPKGARFTHELGKKETVRGNATEAALRAALGADFGARAEADAIRAAIGQAWHAIEYRAARGDSILEIRDAAEIAAERAKLAVRARAEWGLSAEPAEKLAAVGLPDGHGRHSLAAMRRLLPHLEQGAPYATAVKSEYQPHESTAPLAKLPGPNSGELSKIADPFVRQRMEALLAGIRNPTVLRTLGELQKVVNTLLRVHGRPDLIRLETTRELKQSVEDRASTDQRQNEREKARAAARRTLREMGKAADGREGDDNVLRLLLWGEQAGRCPYSGEQMGCTDALDATATEIDHIFPVSRSFDDGQANKVVCFLRENRAKGNRTPYEYLSAQPERWTHLTQTVWPQMKGAGWPEAKLRRCLRAVLEQEGEEGFTNRHLTDTGFIARAARDYLGLLFGGGQDGVNAVQPVPGRATALLRRGWCIGLGRLLHGEIEQGLKARDDHRHHAVDALAVALTGPGAVQRLSRWWAQRETTHTRPRFDLPWPQFRDDARRAVEAIVVSHRVQAKLSGALHEDTRLGDTGEMRGEAKLFVKRKAVASLSQKEVEAVRDPAVRAAIISAIAAAGGNQKIALAREIRLPRKDGSAGPVIRRVRVLLPRSSGVMRVHPTYNIHAELGPGSNEHIAIYRDGDAVRFLVTTKREAMQRVQQRNPIVLPVHPAGGRLVFVLRAGDPVSRPAGSNDEVRFVRKFLGSGAILLKPLHMVEDPKQDAWKSPGPLLAAGWRKVSIDPIGRIRPAR